MVTVTAETSLSSSLDDTWAALGRRDSYLCFPGISRAANDRKTPLRGALCHALDLPIVERREQPATLSVSRAGAKNGRRERRFTMRGDLVTIAGRWRLEPLEAGVRLHLTLDYEIAPGLKEHAVNTLRSRSPLPIRTDADAILDRAVDEFFETRFAEQAAAYCERLRARLDAHLA
jgi:hypothetical protein